MGGRVECLGAGLDVGCLEVVSEREVEMKGVGEGSSRGCEVAVW